MIRHVDIVLSIIAYCFKWGIGMTAEGHCFLFLQQFSLPAKDGDDKTL